MDNIERDNKVSACNFYVALLKARPAKSCSTLACLACHLVDQLTSAQISTETHAKRYAEARDYAHT